MTLHLLDISPDALAEELLARGEKRFRATQILEWVWRKGVFDFKRMTNLSLDLRTSLESWLTIFTGRLEQSIRTDDEVTKLLLRWADNESAETVLIPSERRQTACVSTQSGCAMGCAFCASGRGGLGRNLTAGEILEQVLQLQTQTDRRVTNVVFMGMGEPLANYEATVAAVRALIDPARGQISARKITVSTCGLPEGIRRLAAEDLPITLAISLHAPNDLLRARLMPAAAKYPLDRVIAAADEFFRQRGREVTLEYVLLSGVNDTDDCAEQLIGLARHLGCNVNLIGYNPVADLPFQRPADEAVETFANRLRHGGLNVTLRRSRGIVADAACGQLRR